MRNASPISRVVSLVRGMAEGCQKQVPEPHKGALARLEKKVADWQGELHLLEWQIVPRFVRRNDGWTARITMKSDFNIALMEMSDDTGEDEWDWVVVHELVHLILRPLTRLCEAGNEHLERHQAELLETLLTDAEENAVNRVTEAIVGKRLPVIWEKERRERDV